MTLKEKISWFFKGRYKREGIIYSKEYGSYPAEVPYVDYMTIYPGQKALFIIEITRKGGRVVQGTRLESEKR